MKKIITADIADRIARMRARGIAGYLGGVAEEEVEFVKLNYGNINCLFPVCKITAYRTIVPCIFGSY